MDIHSVRLLMKTKSIYEIPLRVTFMPASRPKAMNS